MKVVEPLINKVDDDDPEEEFNEEIGSFKLSVFPFESVMVSTKLNAEIFISPTFDTSISYTIISPTSLIVLPFSSWTTAVFVTLIFGLTSNAVSVISSVVLPSVSSPSSEVSDTLFEFVGEEATADIVLYTPPASIACWVIVKVDS